MIAPFPFYPEGAFFILCPDQTKETFVVHKLLNLCPVAESAALLPRTSVFFTCSSHCSPMLSTLVMTSMHDIDQQGGRASTPSLKRDAES